MVWLKIVYFRGDYNGAGLNCFQRLTQLFFLGGRAILNSIAIKTTVSTRYLRHEEHQGEYKSWLHIEKASKSKRKRQDKRLGAR